MVDRYFTGTENVADVAVLAGGRSSEHEISVQSAASVIAYQFGSPASLENARDHFFRIAARATGSASPASRSQPH